MFRLCAQFRMSHHRIQKGNSLKEQFTYIKQTKFNLERFSQAHAMRQNSTATDDALFESLLNALEKATVDKLNAADLQRLQFRYQFRIDFNLNSVMRIFKIRFLLTGHGMTDLSSKSSTIFCTRLSDALSTASNDSSTSLN